MRIYELRLLLVSPVRSLHNWKREQNLTQAAEWSRYILKHLNAFILNANQIQVRILGSHLGGGIDETFNDGIPIQREAILKIERIMATTCHGIIAFQPNNDSEGVNIILHDMAHLPVFPLSGDLKIDEREMGEIQDWVENLKDDIREAEDANTVSS